MSNVFSAISRKTKIVCTLGPASVSEATLRGLLQAGMNVARLNCSHGTQAEHGERIACIRKLAEEAQTPTAILLDLAGPEIVKLKKKGVEITTTQNVPLATYLGDTAEGEFQSLPCVRQSKILITVNIIGI